MAQTEILTNLTNYVNELNLDLQRESVLTSRFVNQISHMPGIKNAEVINYITSVPVLTAPSCGAIIAPTGSVTQFQNTLTVAPVAYNEVLCYTDFETKYWGMVSPKGSYNEFPPDAFVDVYIADKIDKWGEMQEFAIVAGSPNGTFSNIASNLVTGILYTMTSTSATSSIINPGVTNSYSVSTAISIVDQFHQNTATAILQKKDLTLWMSYADFIIYIAAVRNANFFHFNALESEGGLIYEMYHMGTNLKVSACHGLDCLTNGKHMWFLTSAANLFFGYDDLKDPQNFQFWYSMDLNAACFRMQNKIGINAAYYKYITFSPTF